jgi:lactoylglutathione lyase
MTLEHVALWTPNLERARQFYGDYFGAVATEWYCDPGRQVSAYLLSFASGARLELLQPAKLLAAGRGPVVGCAHLAFTSGSAVNVQALTERLRQAGYAIISEPGTTTQGRYQSVIADPDGNLIEINS